MNLRDKVEKAYNDVLREESKKLIKECRDFCDRIGIDTTGVDFECVAISYVINVDRYGLAFTIDGIDFLWTSSQLLCNGYEVESLFEIGRVLSKTEDKNDN